MFVPRAVVPYRTMSSEGLSWRWLPGLVGHLSTVSDQPNVISQVRPAI